MTKQQRARNGRCAEMRKGNALTVFEHRQSKYTLGSTNVSSEL